MALREQLLAVADELRRRKAAGEKIVSIGEDTLVALRAAVARQAQGPVATTAAPGALAQVIPFPTPASAPARKRCSFTSAIW